MLSRALHSQTASRRSLHLWLTLGLLIAALGYQPVAVGGEFSGYSQPFVFTAGRAKAPTVPFFDSENKLIRLADFKGQVVLVNLWATWCPACIQEMPELAALQQALGDQGVKVLTLNQDLTDGAAVRRYLDQRGYENLTAHRDLNMMFGQAVGQKLLPMTLLFDTAGQEIGYLVGPADWNSASARAFIKRYLIE